MRLATSTFVVLAFIRERAGGKWRGKVETDHGSYIAAVASRVF